MDLSNIESVQDLIQQNNTPDIRAIVEAVYDLNNIQSFKLMKSLVQTHLDFHYAMIEKLDEDGECEKTSIWHRDATLLEVALNCINQVAV